MRKLILSSKKGSKKTLPDRLKELQGLYGEDNVEVWTTDEHRLGLKPILRSVWAPKGKRPQIAVYPRYEWLYLYAFVHPASGRTQWFIMPRVNTDIFSIVLKEFAKTTNKHVLLVMDRASWHTSSKLEMPDSITPLYQPPYSPEVQPAEHLWQFTDQPLANFCPDDLDQLESLLADQCVTLQAHPERIKSTTMFHWWPDA